MFYRLIFHFLRRLIELVTIVEHIYLVDTYIVQSCLFWQKMSFLMLWFGFFHQPFFGHLDNLISISLELLHYLVDHYVSHSSLTFLSQFAIL